MDALTILREQLRQSHELTEGIIDDLPLDQMHQRLDGGTLQSIAAIYVHVVVGEDQLINETLLGQPTRFERDGWSERLVIGSAASGWMTDDISEAIRELDLQLMREYAQLVYADADDYMASLSEADLNPPVTFGSLGEMPRGIFLATILNWHALHHCGELAALKGALGHKGLPF